MGQQGLSSAHDAMWSEPPPSPLYFRCVVRNLRRKADSDGASTCPLQSSLTSRPVISKVSPAEYRSFHKSSLGGTHIYGTYVLLSHRYDCYVQIVPPYCQLYGTVLLSLHITIHPPIVESPWGPKGLSEPSIRHRVPPYSKSRALGKDLRQTYDYDGVCRIPWYE